MSSKQIILFRFHSNFDICEERIKIWKYFNPEIPIYCLYGGDLIDWKTVQKKLSKLPVEDIQISSNPDRYWKWLHPEQTLREWYQAHGNKIKFDLLFDEEWDILPTAPITDIYKNFPSSKAIALTGLGKFSTVKLRWRWVIGSSHKKDFLKFEKYINEAFGIKEIKFASLGPGQIFTPKFLEAFSSLSLDESIIEPIVSEMIYPISAQILNYKMIDTGLYPGWDNREEAIKYFNCWYIPVDKGVIFNELKKAKGRRIFHPVKYQFYLDELVKKSKN